MYESTLGRINKDDVIEALPQVVVGDKRLSTQEGVFQSAHQSRNKESGAGHVVFAPVRKENESILGI